MADYNVNFTRLQSYISPPTQILEAAGVRYCVVDPVELSLVAGLKNQRCLWGSSSNPCEARADLANSRPDYYWDASTIIIPATFWHLDLSQESFATTTFAGALGDSINYC
jgi:hypothetical protein